MKIALMAAISVLGMVQAADAQDGFYYGIGLGVTESSTNAPIVSDYTATATDLSLTLTAGYRFAASGNLQFGIEGNLDVLSGETMSDGADACTGQSPSWCTLDTVLRLRGTVTTELANGGHLTSSLGAVLVDGVTLHTVIFFGQGFGRIFIDCRRRGGGKGECHRRYAAEGDQLAVRVRLHCEFLQCKSANACRELYFARDSPARPQILPSL